MLEVGKLVGTKLVEMPKEVLTDSVPGKVYHLSIETKGVTNEEEVAKTLTSELYNKFKAKVVWMKIENGTIDIQLIGSPFAWLALLAWLPAILSVLGIVMVLVSVYSVISAIPGWAWALLAVGVGMMLFGPKIAGAITSGLERKEYVTYVTGREEKTATR
jgi:hypothetical protein